jgi:hypothetical protein
VPDASVMPNKILKKRDAHNISGGTTCVKR